jgi:hypothetical protein
MMPSATAGSSQRRGVAANAFAPHPQCAHRRKRHMGRWLAEGMRRNRFSHCASPHRQNFDVAYVLLYQLRCQAGFEDFKTNSAGILVLVSCGS